jgi:hypothetical protein
VDYDDIDLRRHLLRYAISFIAIHVFYGVLTVFWKWLQMCVCVCAAS